MPWKLWRPFLSFGVFICFMASTILLSIFIPALRRQSVSKEFILERLRCLWSEKFFCPVCLLISCWTQLNGFNRSKPLSCRIFWSSKFGFRNLKWVRLICARSKRSPYTGSDVVGGSKEDKCHGPACVQNNYRQSERNTSMTTSSARNRSDLSGQIASISAANFPPWESNALEFQAFRFCWSNRLCWGHRPRNNS